MKTVLLGITGCIAAYKACEVVRGLQKAGVQVKVVMTENATAFVGPLTFHALTGQPAATGFNWENTTRTTNGSGADGAGASDPIPHISLGQSADLFLIAPCTADVMAKIAHGIADDLLTSTALAATVPLLIAPAMNVHMYENPATQENMTKLRQQGIGFIEAGDGYLACGDVGRGRLADPEAIVAATLEALGVKRDLAGKHVLITAGPTIEPIDPARYISNRSSGKTGFALAEAAAERGAEVTLITGPVALPDVPGVRMVRVETAREMLEAAEASFEGTDIAIFSAAVCDGRPKEESAHKLKKGVDDEALSRIELIRNPDILATLGARKQPGQVVAGFAAETDDLEANARKKLTAKNADLIVGNLVGEGRGFATDDNQVMLVTGEGIEELPLMPKRQLADQLLDRLANL